ncbi:diguanylate cyclase domain-containing protein [Cryptosporangium sp. NPDC051539]|uniref:diguanylate cyclase domain-containing protein n=1 Tax=Cryptosporangium sp. NPDC051539 TaxID=3363962 RepID=UPI0037945375
MLERRAVARLAVIGSVLGLVTLAGLASWGTVTTNQATTHIRTLNQHADHWARVFARLNLEQDAAEDFVRISDDRSRGALTSMLGSADTPLAWLRSHGDAIEQTYAGQIQTDYRAYTSVLTTLVTAQSQGVSLTRLHVLANEADLRISSLRDQSSEALERERFQLTRYLDRVDRRNNRLMFVSALTFGVAFALSSLCGTVLFRYQRRIERQADDSRHASLHDPLTGLANRVLFSERIERALASAERRQRHVGVLLLDLNRFKQVNDTLGHHVGDALLTEVAARIGAAIRDADTAARLGGDEFGVLLPDVAPVEISAGASVAVSGDAFVDPSAIEEATDVARRIKAAIEAPLELEGSPIDIGASVGVAVYPTHGLAATDLIRHADSAMYVAKRSGRGVVVHVADYPGVLALNPAGESS